MDCDDCIERLYAFLDKELGPGDIREVAKHLDDCAHCGESKAFEERFLKVIRDCGTSEVAPADLRERLAERLRREAPPPTA